MKFVKLGDICKVKNGYAFKSENFTEKGIPIVRISDINDNYVNPIKSVRTTYENTFDNYRIEKGDILIAMSGATTGKFGIYNSDEVAYQNQRVGCFKIIDKSIIDQSYLLQTLKIVKPIIEKKANGGAQPNISANAIEEIKIPLPPISDQLRIAKILNQTEVFIEERKKSILFLENLLKSTFVEIFGDPIKNEKGFKTKILDELCDNIFLGLTSKVDYVENGGYPLIRTTDINGGKLSFEKVKYISEQQHKLITKNRISKRGDLLVSKSGTLGTCAIVDTDREFTTYESIITIQSKKNLLHNYFLIYLIRNENYQIKMLGGKVGGTVGHLNLQMFRNMSINLPPLALQLKFATVVEKVEELRSNYKESLIQLQNLYGALCQGAFKKELNVSEPSTVLNKPSEDKTKKTGDTKNSKVDEIEPIETRHFLVQESLARKIKKKFKDSHFSFEMLLGFLKKEDDYTVNYYSTGEMNNDSSLKKENDLKHFIQTSIVNVEMDEKQKGNVNPYLQIKQFFYNAKSAKENLNLKKENQKLMKNKPIDEISGIYFEIVK